jgi:hypothetical protein
MRLAAALSAGGTTAATIMLAVPARADVDTDFANQLHTYGIYGQRDTTRGCQDSWPSEIRMLYGSAGTGG